MAKKTHWLLVFGDGETYEGLNDQQSIVEVTDEGLRQIEDQETKPFNLDDKHLLSIHTIQKGSKV